MRGIGAMPDAHKSPELDPEILRLELDSCRKEIARLRAANRKLQNDIDEARAGAVVEAGEQPMNFVASPSWVHGQRPDRQNREPNRHHLPDSLGCLAVLCWCEAEIVHVDADRVRRGQTGSCGADRCQP